MCGGEAIVTPVEVGVFRSPHDMRTFSMEHYAKSLTQAIGDLDPEFKIVHVQAHAGGRSTLAKVPGIGRLRAAWRRYPGYMRTVRKTRFGLNHIVDQAYAHLVRALPAERTVVTCHDIFPYKRWKNGIPGVSRRLVPPLTVAYSLRSLRQARRVITPSAATKDDLKEYLAVPDDSIRVIPYGVGPEFHRFGIEQTRAIVEKYSLGGPEAKHILCVDTGTPYKNQRAMVEVLARLRESVGSDVYLAHVGRPLPTEEAKWAEEQGIAPQIIELGSLDRQEIVELYNRCDVLLFPSHYEGFGWPPLEAMAAGLPVVSSRWKSVSEVVGDAALSSDSHDHDALAEQVRAVLEQPGLSDDLRERGLDRAKSFSWPRAAEQVIDIYREVLRGRDS